MVPGEKVSAVIFCEHFLAYAVHIDWCYHSINKHSSTVGLNIHPYDDIGDASSSLRGSTSSSMLIIKPTLDISKSTFMLNNMFFEC